MQDQFILAHDLGTGSDKAVLTTLDGQLAGMAQKNYSLAHPRPGYAEQDPDDWWNAVCETTNEVIDASRVNPEKIIGITFSSLMQCLIAVDEQGRPLYPAITWLDGRSAQTIREKVWRPPRIKGYNPFRLLKFLRITGGTPGHSGKDQIGKLLWLQEYRPDIVSKTFKYIDAKDYIIFKLCNKFVTSVDVAVVWWLLDWRNKKYHWSEDLCRVAGIDVRSLSEVRHSAEIVGEITLEAAEKTGLKPGTPVINGAGDLGAAAIGSGAILDGEMHVNIGTSGWVAGHFIKPKKDVVHYTGCIGSAYPEKYYLGMAHQETAGLCLDWLAKNVITGQALSTSAVKSNSVYHIMDTLASECAPGCAGLIFAPWLYGERCPIDADFVRGGFLNLSLQHSQGDIIRAVLEGVALNTRWALETLENLYKPVFSLNIIGGGATSDLWCQIMADVTNRKINQMENARLSGAIGVALLASHTLGFIREFEDIKQFRPVRKTFLPQPQNRDIYDRSFQAFKEIFKNNKKWFRKINHTELNLKLSGDL